MKIPKIVVCITLYVIGIGCIVIMVLHMLWYEAEMDRLDWGKPLCYRCGAIATRKTGQIYDFSKYGKGITAIWLCDKCKAPSSIPMRDKGAVFIDGARSSSTPAPTRRHFYVVVIFFLIAFVSLVKATCMSPWRKILE